MSESKLNFYLEVHGKKVVCPLGEVVGMKMIAENKIPVISCEGGCFRGEIARMAAHLVGKKEPFARSCHGEIFTAPTSAMADWTIKAEKVIVIDGCFMKCHGRILRNIIGKDNMIQFDALPMYNKNNKYTDTMLYDDVPEKERKQIARQVADKVISELSQIFDFDDVSKEERKEVTYSEADCILDSLNNPLAGGVSSCAASNENSSECCG
jgi:uncharacterized metal-binding protein